MPLLYISLGANTGSRAATLRQALEALDRRLGRRVGCSSFYETEPVGFVSPHKFLNAAAAYETELTPRQLLRATQEVERLLGRTSKSRDGRYADRPIDIDLLMLDGVVVSEPDLCLPHPAMAGRRFVLEPLCGGASCRGGHRERASEASQPSPHLRGELARAGVARGCQPSVAPAQRLGAPPRCRHTGAPAQPARHASLYGGRRAGHRVWHGYALSLFLANGHQGLARRRRGRCFLPWPGLCPCPGGTGNKRGRPLGSGGSLSHITACPPGRQCALCFDGV